MEKTALDGATNGHQSECSYAPLRDGGYAIRPEGYRETCVVTRDVPHTVAEGETEGTHTSSGTLHVGRVIWIQRKLADCEDDARISAFADGVGIMEVDPRCLGHAS